MPMTGTQKENLSETFIRKYSTKMKILLIHNSHRSGSSSGDDIVFKKESYLLEKHSHQIIRFNPSNDDFDKSSSAKKIFTAFQIPWSFSSYSKIKKELIKKKPDVIHIHNFFPLLSPSIYHAIHSAGIPVVQTLHDFRFLCPTAFLMRDEHICDECKDGAFIKSIQYGCFKNSRLQSIPVALMHKLHHFLKSYTKKIDAYICLTKSQKTLFLEAGFDNERLFIKPNFIEDTFEEARSEKQGEYAVFIGRLGKEKGLKTLIEAWKHLPDVPLKIIGDGPDAEEFSSLAHNLNIENIDFLGYMPHHECMKLLGEASFLVMPSIWYETFGLTIVEAFSHCKPVVASNMGAMADIVKDGETGLLVEAKNAKDLADKAKWLWNNPEECLRMGQNARREYKEKYTHEKNYEMLMNIYQAVIEKKKAPDV